MAAEVTERVVSPPVDLETVPRRRTGRWISAAVLLFLVFFTINSLLRNPRMQWDIVAEYFFSDVVLSGLKYTLVLTVVVMIAGCLLGIMLAVMRQSKNPVLSAIAQFYIWLFRSVPPLVQLLVWYNLAAVYPVVSFGIPFGPTFFEGSANAYITPFVAALLGLGLNEGAYMGEIIRAGIDSVDEGQVEAAKSLGFGSSKIMRRVVLPQAMRVIIPPTGNETITVIKATSLVSVISMTELLYSVQLVYSKTFQTIPMLVVACIWYLCVTSLLTVGQFFLEKRLRHGSGSRQTLAKRLIANFTSYRAPVPEPEDVSEGTRP